MATVIDKAGTVPADQLARCKKKIGDALFILSQHQKNNGNPLLFSYALAKPIYLVNTQEDFMTAGTDGKRFYFHPDFIDELSTIQLVSVFKHECWHNLASHCDLIKKVQYGHLANLACDLIVNSLVESDWKKSDHGAKNCNNIPFWTEPFGKPVDLNGLKTLIKHDNEKLLKKYSEQINNILKNGDIENGLNNSLKQIHSENYNKDPKTVYNRKDYIHPDDNYIFVDEKCLGKSAIEIYKELLPWYESLSEELKALLSAMLFDTHIKDERTKEDCIGELLRAITHSKECRGTVPLEVESILKELLDPTLDLSNFIRHTIDKVKLDSGNIPSYTRFKRRFVGSELYYPKYYHFHPKILVLLDTSGSMSDEDITRGVSELKQFANKADVYIVPTDAEPHWNKVSKVSKASDFSNIKIVGRGGTVFYEFFANYKQKLKKYGKFNSIIVISDGYSDIIPEELNPGCPVGWVLTSPSQFNQNFGQPIYLKYPQ